ncbi:MAG TPA: urease accessory protein UreE [Chloroflexota bacterium]|nr:urease accessory protein UreE [Chloroflexota bacterium]
MRRIEHLLGNVHDDPTWRQRCEAAAAAGVLETVTLAPWEVAKRRLRATTDAGTELGIALAAGELRDGAVLDYDPASGRLIVARVAGQPVLVLTIEGDDPTEVAARAVRLGHILGNQHWPARVQGRRVEVLLPLDERVVRSVLKTYQLEGVRYEFVEAAAPPEPNLTVDPSHRHG